MIMIGGQRPDAPASFKRRMRVWFRRVLNSTRRGHQLAFLAGRISRDVKRRMMATDHGADIAAVQGIAAVPRILEVVCRSTGMGFAAVARVTEQRWICCAVRDEIAFGLTPGGELEGRNHHLSRDPAERRGRRHRQCRRRPGLLRSPHAGAIRLPELYLDADHARRRVVLRHAVRDRSEAGAAEHAADDRHVQAVCRTDRHASGRRQTASPPAKRGCSASARPRNCASSSSPCSATICATRWRRSRRAPIC